MPAPLWLALAALAAPADTVTPPADATPAPAPLVRAAPVGATAAPGDTTRPRPKAVEVSDAYELRLRIHRYGSYTMLPIFAAQYVVGQKLLNQKRDAFAGRGNGISDNVKTTHQVLVGATGALFGINTVTGVWNLYESRKQPEGRGQRIVHAVLMLASDAGFTATGLLGNRASENAVKEAETHRNVAVASMAVATAGTALMWFFRD